MMKIKTNISLSVFEELIKKGWNKQTSVRPTEWRHTNPALGQCAVTALTINDFFKGKISRAEMSDGTTHYWNILPNGKKIDLTRDQYKNGETILKQKIVDRSYILENSDTKNRYCKLLERLEMKDSA